MISYLVSMFSEHLQIQLQNSDIERAHRIGVKKQDAPYPRIVIFKLFHFQTKVDILKAGKKLQTVSIVDRKIRIVPDMSASLRRRRGEYWPLRQALDKIGLKSQVRNPAMLLVWNGDQRMQFESCAKATEELKKKFPDLTF